MPDRRFASPTPTGGGLDIEQRIADALVANGYFSAYLTDEELAVILSNVIFALIGMQKVAGFDVGLEHRVQHMAVRLARSTATVETEVEIFKPVKARLAFRYVLENDPAEPGEGLRLKANSLQVEQHVRRFDVRARAALAVMDVQRLAAHELRDVRDVIRRTLPPQLQRLRVDGAFTDIRLRLDADRLDVYLEGEFAPLVPAD